MTVAGDRYRGNDGSKHRGAGGVSRELQVLKERPGRRISWFIIIMNLYDMIISNTFKLPDSDICK